MCGQHNNMSERLCAPYQHVPVTFFGMLRPTIPLSLSPPLHRFSRFRTGGIQERTLSCALDERNPQICIARWKGLWLSYLNEKVEIMHLCVSALGLSICEQRLV